MTKVEQSTEEIELPNPEQYCQVHFENMPASEGFEKTAVNPVIKDSNEASILKVDKSKGKENPILSKQKMEEVKAPAFSPSYLRPIPQIDEEEIQPEGIWLIPGACPEPYFDFTIGNDVFRVKQLVKKAHKMSLKNQADTELIKKTFQNDVETLIHYGFPPNRLPGVILHNKEIAMEFCTKMTPFNNITQYFNVFLRTEINLHTLEVFNQLVHQI